MLLFNSLKNPTYPEFIFTTLSSVMCVDIHENLSYLVAVGFYDGCVAVYNLKEHSDQPAYMSTAKTGIKKELAIKANQPRNKLIKNCKKVSSMIKHSKA